MSGARTERRPRSRYALLAAFGAAVLAAGVTAAITAGTGSAAAPVGRSPLAVPAGTGASVPFTEYEAEAATTTGSVIGPDYTQATVASEASGREAVKLAQGQYVEFTLTAAADAVDVSYNLAQGASGTLSVYVNGTKLSGHLNLNSKYSYLDTGNITGSKTHHFFDDARMLLGTTASVGDKVRLQVDSGDVPATIDVADFENTSPSSQPSNSISVTDAPYNADPTGAADATSAINQAASDARSQGKSLWLPQGTYLVSSPLQVNGLTMTGAGPWYSVLHGSHIVDSSSSSGATTLKNFAVIGEITTRSGSSANSFINESLGSGSTVDNVWIQHQEVGIWLMGANNANITIQNCRILDNTADGINFNGTVTNSTVTNNFIRNTGDDGIALWSLYSADANDTITNNTVVQPNLANGIALYGGTDNTVSDNVVADTNALGSGIAVSNQQFIAGQGFSPLAGTITMDGNYTIRAGAMNPNWNHPMSAIRFDAYDYPIQNVSIKLTNTHILDSPYSAIEIVGGAGTGLAVTGLTVSNATISNVGTVVLQAETQGSGTFSNVVATGVGVAGVYNCPYPTGNPDFTVTDGGGNSGWDTTWGDCSTWPTPGGGNPSSPPPADGNLAQGHTASSSGYTQVYTPANAFDGDANTYWESTDSAFPQWLQVDLGSATSIDRIVLKLPPASAWEKRTQTLAVSGSTTGSSFDTIAGSADYTFDPSSGNTATITFDPTTTRYVRLTFTANTAWPAGQASEVEIYQS
jgi:alpha-1,3-glucanase-like protein/F5/8 type C domain-containing protein